MRQRNVGTCGRIGSFAEIEPDDLGHRGVDRLVVGDAVADRVGERDVAGAVGLDQPGDAEHAVRAEGLGVDELVVDAAVDHVDRTRPLGGLEVDALALDEEVAALDQRHAHAPRQEAVLEVRRVVRPGGEDHDRALAVAAGKRRQHLAQPHRVVAHRAHAGAMEDARERALHHAPVLDHVGDAGRHAQVVLEHDERAVGPAHQVDAGDVHVDAERRLDARRPSADARSRTAPGRAAPASRAGSSAVRRRRRGRG